MALVSPSWSVFYELGAVFTCLAGSHASLLLASASIRLRLPMLMVLAALQFSVQSIFSLHFVSMCGMGFPMPWGFDIGLTLVSLVVVALFGTSAITLTLVLRQQLQPRIQEHFGPELETPGPLFYPKLLLFALYHVSFLKLLLAVVLMVAGAAGCHHLGMWSIHGLRGAQLASQLTVWSFLTTVALGGAVCVVAILAFLLVPEGKYAIVTAVALTAGIAAFHFFSAIWGMRYLDGVEGVTTTAVIGQEAIIMFVVAQGAISQVITAVFSQMAVRNHATMAKQLQMAQTLGKYIAEMDLEPAKAMQLEAEDPSALEQTLFHIVNNLLLYRPYLPDTLFANANGSNSHGAKDTDDEGEDQDDEGLAFHARPCSGGSGTDSSSTISTICNVVRRISNALSEKADLFHPPLHRPSMSIAESSDNSRQTPRRRSRRLSQRPSSSRPVTGKVPKTPKTLTPKALHTKNSFRNLALGLKPSHLTVLRIRLTGLEFGSGKALNAARVEDRLTAFSAAATAQIKAFGGTIVMCSGGQALAFWPAITPDKAIETALAIQKQCADLNLVQVVQSAPFLSGNLATEHLRCFNIVGPLDWDGQQLLRVGSGGRHIFVTSNEWQRVRFMFICLPYEQLLMDGNPSTLYTVLPNKATSGSEWMYEVEGNLQATSFEAVDRCWHAYVRGKYAQARILVEALTELPGWYTTHLLMLVDQAVAGKVLLPLKSLQLLAWPPSAVVNPQAEPDIVIRDM